MALTHDQVMIFMSGILSESTSIQKDWGDIYGKEDPQESIDAIVSLIDNAYDVISSHIYEEQKYQKMMLDRNKNKDQPKKQEECVAVRVHTASSLEDLGRILTTPRL